MNILQMVEDYRFAAKQDKNPAMGAKLIVEEYIEWYAEALGLKVNGKPINQDESELKEMADLVYVIFGYANSKGWDLNEAVKRVHENNMGRMYQVGECTECMGTGYTHIGCVDGMSRECDACDGEGEHRWIKYREDGKVVKNLDYPKISLEDLV